MSKSVERRLTLVPWGGLANRIYVISSAISFCKHNHMKLRVVWFKDWGMGADFHKIFTLSSEIENVEIIDARWYDNRYARPRKGNLWLPYLWQQFVFDKTLYIKEIDRLEEEEIRKILQSYSSVYLIYWTFFYSCPEMFQSLQPAADVQTRIKAMTASFSNQRTIGIHIRRTDLATSVENSPISLFINKMQEELAIDPQTKFYVASDSEEEKAILKRMFKESTIMLPQKARRDTKEGIKNAMVELYTLSSTIKVYGSSGSSYSLLAGQISDTPVEILSQR
jgi:hypothetical protein